MCLSIRLPWRPDGWPAGKMGAVERAVSGEWLGFDSRPLLPPPWRLMFWFGLFVCQQDYARTTRLIFMKLGGEPEHGPRKTPFTFGVEPQMTGSDLQMRCHF